MTSAPPHIRSILPLIENVTSGFRAIGFLGGIFLLLGVLIYPGTARADYVTPHAEVVCQKGLNVALIRFTETWNEDRIVYRQLPARVDEGLSATRTLNRSDCTMANGWAIRIRQGEKPWKYGMDGLDRPAFFSLWIAKRKILSRKEWKPGYGNEHSNQPKPWLIGLIIHPDRLTYCYVPDSMNAPEKGVISCRDETFRLERHKVDRMEYAPSGSRPSVGTILLQQGSITPDICRKFLRLRRGVINADLSAPMDSAQIFDLNAPPRDRDLRINVAAVEVSPGVHRQLVRWNSWGTYFDGDVMLFAPMASDPWKILKPSMLYPPDDRFPSNELPAGWNVISGGLPNLYHDIPWRYVHFDTQWIDKKLYLLAQPSNVEERPTAILVQPLAQGFKRVCVFQRVEPHF